MNILHQLLFYIQSFLLAVTPMTSYTEGVVGQPRSFFPTQSMTQNDKTISSLIYRGLFKYNNFGDLVPDLADSWAVSDNETVYTIKIKDNQVWSDGTKITSNDLIYTAFNVTDLAGVATDKIDELTVRYTLPNKFSPFISMLTVGVIQANSHETQNPLIPVSSGPFRVVRLEKSGPIVKQVILYNENESQNIKKLIFKFYENDDELVTASKLGEIDGFLSSKQHEIANFDNYKFPIQGVYYALFFNLRNEKFKEVDLRQNLEKVLPIEQLISGRGILAQGAISRSNFTNREVVDRVLNPKPLENLAGFSISITVPNIKNQVALAEDIKNFWEDTLHLEVTLVKVDSDNFYNAVVKDRNFQVLLYGQEISRDPDRYINWHSAQVDSPGLNLSGFFHVRADRALEEGRNEVDSNQRMVHYNEFQKVISDQVPAIFLHHPYINYYVSKYISGIGEKYTFTQADRFLDFGKWVRVETN